jgi:exopolysaccharide biosynthesis polyprenyl glycosylphosphotransferase
MAWVLAGLLVCTGRFGARRVAYAARHNGHFVAPALIVGANQEAAALVEQFANPSSSGLSVRGVISPSPAEEESARRLGLPLLGSLDALGHTLDQQEIREVIVASSALSERELLMITQEVAQHPNVSLRLSSGLYEVLTTGMHVATIGSVPLMTINRLRLTTGETVLKGLLDFTFIIATLPLHLPLFLVIALLIKLDSPGPIFHRRRVVGVGGREFDAFKFRTMYVDGDALLAARPDLQEQLARDHKLKEDPRITRVGRFLRKVSLDELPQLINVLLGQMSLVGPRMVHPTEVAKYGRMKDNLFTVKPGLTGMWQVSGRSDLSYEERVRLDMLYIRNYSLWLDLHILVVQTLPAVLRGRGAY